MLVIIRKINLDFVMREDDSADKLKVSKSVKRHEEIVTETFEIVNDGP